MPRREMDFQIAVKIRWIAFTIIIVSAVIGLAYWNSILSSRKVQQETNHAYSQAMNGLIFQLQQAGLVQAGHIGTGNGSDTFIVILAPTTGEVTDEEIKPLIQLITFTAQVFERDKSLISGDIQLTFQKPTKQQIIFVSRPQGFPAPLNMGGEYTIRSNNQPGMPISVVNLSGTPFTLGSTFTTTFATIQAVCLGYAIQQNSNADPACNVIAANAAAGWVGIDQKTAESWLNALGTTNLSYIGSKDIKFRFIDFIYQRFLR